MFKAMVTCCCPSEEDRDDEQGDEHTRLIRNGGSHAQNRWGATGAYGTTGSGVGRDQRNGPASTPADDEQAILARILQDTANSVIDVSTADAHTVEPREYMERARKYNQQLSSQITAASLQQATGGASPANVSIGKRTSTSGGQLSSTSGATVTSSSNRCLLTDSSLTTSGGAGGSSASFSSPDKILSSPPISVDDLFMIKQLSTQVARQMIDVRVEHKEDLVVQFAPS